MNASKCGLGKQCFYGRGWHVGKRLSSMASATFAADADGVRRRGRAGSQLVFAGDGFDAGFGAGDDGVLNEGDGRVAEMISGRRWRGTLLCSQLP